MKKIDITHVPATWKVEGISFKSEQEALDYVRARQEDKIHVFQSEDILSDGADRLIFVKFPCSEGEHKLVIFPKHRSRGYENNWATFAQQFGHEAQFATDHPSEWVDRLEFISDYMDNGL